MTAVARKMTMMTIGRFSSSFSSLARRSGLQFLPTWSTQLSQPELHRDSAESAPSRSKIEAQGESCLGLVAAPAELETSWPSHLQLGRYFEPLGGVCVWYS